MSPDPRLGSRSLRGILFDQPEIERRVGELGAEITSAGPSAADEVVRTAIVELIRLSDGVDTLRGERIDISPGAMLNNSLGADDGTGYPENPATHLPYAPNVVDLADYQRVVTEFWADGPRSETPPGHWNVLANAVADPPSMRDAKRIGGSGRPGNDLEWDVKVYLALNGAVRWPWFEAAMRLLSAPELGRPLFAALTLVLLLRDRRRGLLLLLGAALTITLSDQLSSHLIKPWFERTRPLNRSRPRSR